MKKDLINRAGVNISRAYLMAVKEAKVNIFRQIVIGTKAAFKQFIRERKRFREKFGTGVKNSKNRER